jgi:hypothetical protein
MWKFDSWGCGWDVSWMVTRFVACICDMRHAKYSWSGCVGFLSELKASHDPLGHHTVVWFLKLVIELLLEALLSMQQEQNAVLWYERLATA